MCSLEKRGRLFLLRLTGDGEHRLNPTLLESISSNINRIRSDPSSSRSVLITTADGKFFSNGYDLALTESDPSLPSLMDAKLRSLVADIISLPMPTIAAVTGHASAAGFILAMSHDYILMRRDRGFLRDVMLTAAKLTADQGLEMGIVESAHGGSGVGYFNCLRDGNGN
ncbi:unnamed protein product [Arabis nemorensis]|uniref:Uncharacterized protein n=1 Tax=Arabis nemorensis TaxID=586526 RepID=A0A565AZ26_9BRAS|nr:unnamed protein product [Arabis nemorensis]